MTPTTPTTPKSCCEDFFPMTGRHRPGCHTDSTKKCNCNSCAKGIDTDHSAALEEALRRAPQHTSQEKDYERDYSHYHCWDQDQPPACGIPIEKHEQCCLCDLKPAPHVKESSEKNFYQTRVSDVQIGPKLEWEQPSFTDRTIAEFREKFYSNDGSIWNVYTRNSAPILEWLSSKLEGAYHSGRQDGFEHARESEESDEEIKKAERERILTLTESKKVNPQPVYPNKLGMNSIEATAWNAALNALAEELQK